jgi:hypothetical protein
MCYNCSHRAFRLSPVPRSLEGLREVLCRDRRWQKRRQGSRDRRIYRLERRVGERRVPSKDHSADWVNADDLIVEMVEIRPDPSLTRISTPPPLPQGH